MEPDIEDYQLVENKTAQGKLYSDIETGLARLHELSEQVSAAVPRRKKKVAKRVTLAEPIASQREVSIFHCLTCRLYSY